jgi:hypothetical protein
LRHQHHHRQIISVVTFQQVLNSPDLPAGVKLELSSGLSLLLQDLVGSPSASPNASPSPSASPNASAGPAASAATEAAVPHAEKASDGEKGGGSDRAEGHTAEKPAARADAEPAAKAAAGAGAPAKLGGGGGHAVAGQDADVQASKPSASSLPPKVAADRKVADVPGSAPVGGGQAVEHVEGGSTSKKAVVTKDGVGKKDTGRKSSDSATAPSAAQRAAAAVMVPSITLAVDAGDQGKKDKSASSTEKAEKLDDNRPSTATKPEAAASGTANKKPVAAADGGGHKIGDGKPAAVKPEAATDGAEKKKPVTASDSNIHNSDDGKPAAAKPEAAADGAERIEGTVVAVADGSRKSSGFKQPAAKPEVEGPEGKKADQEAANVSSNKQSQDADVLENVVCDGKPTSGKVTSGSMEQKSTPSVGDEGHASEKLVAEDKPGSAKTAGADEKKPASAAASGMSGAAY